MPLLAPLLLAPACTPAAVDSLPLLQPGTPVALEPADAVAVADLDGDGRDDLVRVRQGAASWWDQRVELGGAPQAVGRGDVDGDGAEEALIATGMGREAREAPARLWAIGRGGARLLWERAGARAQVTDLHVLPGAAGAADRVFLATFRDERTVEGGFVVDGALQVVHDSEMALRMAPLADGATLVGRLYGDEPRSDGDLHRIGADGAREAVATHRGVRALAATDLDGDGAQDWLIADGWHYAYGEHADPELRLVPGGQQPGRVIARLDGSYTIERLEIARPADGGDAVILATGSHGAVLLQRDALGWAPTAVAELREVDNAVLARDGDALSVIVSGQPARRIPLRRTPPSPP